MNIEKSASARVAIASVSVFVVVLSYAFSGIALADPLNVFVPPKMSALGHSAVIRDVLFNGAQSPELEELVQFISQGMDYGRRGAAGKHILSEPGSSFLEAIRHEFGDLKGFGKRGKGHRAWGHWSFNSSIPEEFLAEVEEAALKKEPPITNAREIVLKKWMEFVKTRQEAVKQALGLSSATAPRTADRVARGIASMMNDCHVLGDYITKDTRGLRSIESALDDFHRSLVKVLGKKNGEALWGKMIAEIAKINKKGMTNQEYANAVLNILRKYGPEIWSNLEKVLRRLGFNGKFGKVSYEALSKLIGEQNGQIAEKVKDCVKAITKKIPKKTLKRLLKTPIAKAIAKYSKKLAKNEAVKKVGKGVGKAVPFVTDIAFWAYDMYDAEERYLNGEITTAERGKEWFEKTGEAGGALAGWCAGWKAAEKATENVQDGRVQLAAKVAGGITGAAVGGWTAGKIAAKSHDVLFDEPVEICLRDAEAHDPDAMYFAGRFYDEPRYVLRDYGKSFDWFKAASEAGFAKAKPRLASCYLLGKGTGVDRKKAFALYMESFDNRDWNVAVPLARMMMIGAGCKKNTRAAVRILKTAIDNKCRVAEEYASYCFARDYKLMEEFGSGNDIECIRRVGEYFEIGLMVEPSKETAEYLYSVAASLGDILAEDNLDDYEDGGRELEEEDFNRMLEEYLAFYSAVSDEMAKGYLRELAELGIGKAQLMYARIDDVEPEKWLQIHAEKRNLYAVTNLISRLSDLGRKKELYRWFSIGAELGDRRCMEQRAIFRLKGIGVAENPREASQWMTELRSVQTEEFVLAAKQITAISFADYVIKVFSLLDPKLMKDGYFYFYKQMDAAQTKGLFDRKKIVNALKDMMINDPKEDIYAQYDSTFWGGGGEGFVLTQSGIYFSNGVRLFCKWEDVSKFEIYDYDKFHVVGTCVNLANGSKYEGGFVNYKDADDLLRNSGHIVDALNVIAAAKGGSRSVFEGKDLTRIICQPISTNVPAMAQFKLGESYYKGEGVNKDVVEAIKWYRMAAEQGHASAQYQLGLWYDDGFGRLVDATLASIWYHKAAKQGLPIAQFKLGCLYESNKSVTNASEAVTWYRKAAEQSYPAAQSALGHCYENGIGVDKDATEAMKWYRKAADQGDEKAKKRLKKLK